MSPGDLKNGPPKLAPNSEPGPGAEIQVLDPRTRLELAKRVLARRSLIQFTKRFYPQYVPGWVHHDIARRLEHFLKEVEEKKSPRLMLLVPPRHGKSELASIRFPAFALGHHPEWEVINCGYNLELPMKFSRKVREIVRDPGYKPLFPTTMLDPDSQSAEAWNTTAGGGLTAAGVGGGITGKGATILTIDDPIKNQEEADSIITRDGLWDWYWSTAYTRLAPGGGVLIIQCMTGDTPVLRPDGSTTRLDQIRAGDEVATYEDGRLTTSTVRAQRSNGRDSILKITTTSGKIVRSNGRHPFLVETNGKLRWIRARSLRTHHKIVVLKGSGVSGKARLAPQKGANCPPSAEDSARATTTRRSGLTDTARRLSTAVRGLLQRLSIATASLWKSTSKWLQPKAVAALSAASYPSAPPRTGNPGFALTTATTPARSAPSFATTAMPPSDIFELSALHSPQLNSSDFTVEQIVSVEPDGEEEVFDVQIDRTENFIANGLVSHNTWWHDDDLAGRLQQRMQREADADQFVIIKYPALAEQWEYRNKTTDLIERYDQPLETHHENLTDRPAVLNDTYDLLRAPNEALHPQRYNETMLTAMKANQPPRIWSALYQQNPVPDEGIYFRREYFSYEPVAPLAYNRNVYQAWDFAIGEKQLNDYTVGVTLIQDEADFLHLVEVVRFKGDSFTIVEEMLNAAERWGGEPTAPLTLGVEDSQIWRAIKPLFEKRCSERGMYPPYEVLKPLTDKMARARNLQGRMQQNRVYFPKSATWLNDVQTELLRFPAGAHDDIVDAMAWAVNLCIGRAPKPKPKVKEPESWKDRLKNMPGVFTTDGSTHMSA